MTTNLLVPAVLLLFTLVFGLWLTKSGKPYKAGLFNIHKLLALATVILSGIILLNRAKVTGIDAGMITGILVLAGILVIALFGSGALLSIGKPEHKAILITHRVAPILVVLTATWILILHLNGLL